MSFWSKVKDFFSGGSAANNKSGRTSSSADNFDDSNEGYRNYSGNLANDLTMGLSTFGLSGEAQAEKLADLGYSPGAIQDYQNRTAESKKRLAEQPSGGGGDDNNSTTTTDTSTDTDTDTTTTATSTDTTTSLDTDTNTALTNVETISTNTFTDNADFSADVSVGAAEDEAIDLMKKGRKATILTSSKGLLSGDEEGDGRTRRRRSLIGG